MNRRQFLRSTALAAFAAAGACRREETAAAKTLPRLVRPLRVEATTPILAELARRVGGEAVDVRSLVEPGAKVEWKRGGTMEGRILTADAVVSLGLGHEAALSTSFDRAQEAKIAVIPVADELPDELLFPQPDQPDKADPHVWLDPLAWAECTHPLVKALSRLAPGHAEDIETRGFAVRFELKQLADELKQTASFLAADRRRVTTRRAGLRYLGRVAGLEIVLGEPDTTRRELGLLEELDLSNLRPPGEKIVLRTHSLDLATTDGLCRHALELVMVGNA